MLGSLLKHPRYSASWISRISPVADFASHHAPSASEEELQEARQWLRELKPDTIPHNICEVTFSRSSGPGGQNVNNSGVTPNALHLLSPHLRVNSKATLQVSLARLCPLLPALLIPGVRQSRYYKSGSDALVIQSDNSRKQADNTKSGFTKLYQMIEEVGRAAVPGETSEEQRGRVKDLAKADDERRLRQKKMASSKKSARKSGKGGASDY